jgi:hypothetical protein
MILFESIASSNIPQSQKSALTRYFDSITKGRASEYLETARGMGIRGHHVEAGGHLFRSSLEHGSVGLTLGAMHAEMGLDHVVALDAVLAALAGMGAIAFAKSEVSTDFRNISGSALSVFSFRKGYSLMAEKRLAAGKQPAGVFAKGTKIAGESDWGAEVDPILETAKGL